jgi:hypothetical protein
MVRHISLDVNPETKHFLEKLVNFCKKHISSKVLSLIYSINESIVNKFCSYIFNTYPRPLMEGDSRSLNLHILTGFEPKISDQLLNRLKTLSPQISLQDQITKLREMRATKEKLNEFERDKEMLNFAILEILLNPVTEFGLQEHRIEPLFELPLADISIQKHKDSSSQRENRLKERKSNRDFLNIQNKTDLKTQIDQKIIQIIENAASHKAEGDNAPTDTLRVEDNYSNRRLFGWINLDRFLLKTDISFKKLFTSFMSLTFEHLVRLENFEFKILNEFCPPPKNKIQPSQDISTDEHGILQEENNWSTTRIPHSEDSLNELFDFGHTAFKQSLISLVGLLFVLDHYSYLFTQQSVFPKDILATGFSTSEDLDSLSQGILQEIKGLEQDLKRILLLPDIVNLGIFKLNLISFKDSVILHIRDNKKSLKKALINEMKNQIEQIETGIKYIYNICNSIPSNVDDYIELKKKLESEEFQKKISRIQIYSKAFDALRNSLEFLKDLDEAYELLLKKLFINNVLKSCFEFHKDFSETFKNSRLNFYDEISLHRIDMLNEYSVM